MTITTALLVILVVTILALAALLLYEARQLASYKETMALFIEANAEVFSVVNVNASVSRELATRLEIMERNSEFFKVVLDAHAHVLRIYAPVLQDFKEPISNKIEGLEKITSEDFEVF